MTLDSETVARIHDEWAARQPADAPTLCGPGGNLYFSDDEEFWQMIDAEWGNTSVEVG